MSAELPIMLQRRFQPEHVIPNQQEHADLVPIVGDQAAVDAVQVCNGHRGSLRAREWLEWLEWMLAESPPLPDRKSRRPWAAHTAGAPAMQGPQPLARCSGMRCDCP